MFFRVCAILFATIFITACGSSTSPSGTPEAAPAGATTITMVSGSSTLTTTAYSPNPITVSIGTTVSWLNSDSTTHTAVANGGAFTSPNVAPNARFNFTFTTAGTFPYHCTIHPNMVGTITVQ
jgi:plastocyanin